MNSTSSQTPPGAVGLAVIVGSLFLLQIGAVIQHVVAAPSMSDPLPPSVLFNLDPDSDRVAATAAEFRVDESGAATYSIPLFAAPGTAGVAPRLALNYSSQGGNGALGKGWSIGGLSSVARCRATREAGDFIENGQPVDGSPAPINFTASDRFCLDGQRLLPHSSASGACPSAGGMTGVGYRTEIESFQRVCAYSDAAGPKFFTVERKDGSTSWYGDRDNSTSANRDDGYVNSTAPGKEASALSWAQTRFQDSTGNYIDYLYVDGGGEHRLDKVRYTGKTVLPGQPGSALAPYAEITFNYSTYFSTSAYVSGGLTRMTQRLDSITSSADHDYNGSYSDLRHYTLSYDHGSAATILTSVQECSDTSRQICAGATAFGWSQSLTPARNLFETQESSGSIPNGSLSKFEGLKFGDIDGDGRQDLVWMKDGASGESCSTESVYVAFGRLDANGSPYFTVGSPVMCTPAELAWSAADSTWFLLDYDGDGREDIFLRGNAAWVGYRSSGNTTQPFVTSINVLTELAQPIPAGSSKEAEPQLADVNGDGLIDLVYPRGTGLAVRVMERGGSYGFRWGSERALVLFDDVGTNFVIHGLYRKNNYQQLNDFNGDARSDLLINVDSQCGGGGGGPPDPDPGPPTQPQAATPTATSACAVPFVIAQTTPGTVTAKRYGVAQFSPNETMSFADINGDGLTDWISHGDVYGIPAYGLNTGTGLTGGGGGNLGFGVITKQLQVTDANGDGRADVLYPRGDAMHFVARYGTSAGGFTDAVDLPNVLTACSDLQCLPTRSYLFGDFDGDGNPDYMRIKWDTNSPVYYSRGGPANRFVPRDVITKVTNGMGAETDIVYAPLTNKDLYRPGTGTRNAAVWGRGSPVQDLLAPMYVVARASSSSPQAGAPGAKATIHYRYSGARLQAGGRGFLGFAAIDTIDVNQSGGYVVTTTSYHQNFPFTGLPSRTIKAAVANQAYVVPACLAAPIVDGCFTPAGFGLPGLGGSWFSNSTQFWQADREGGAGFDPGVQQALFPSTMGTEEKLRDPFTGAQTSRVVTTLSYGSHGNVAGTTVDTYTGTAGGPDATVITSNGYGDDVARWRLGRLTSATVTHRRPGQPDVVRNTAFAYAMGGAATGLLTEERTQIGGPADQDLRKLYSYDEFGNKTLMRTCAAASSAICNTSPNFRSTDEYEVVRYSRVTYDSRGRFPIKTSEPFWNGQQSQERDTQTVLARNVFGAVESALDVNGVHAYAVAGAFGRGTYAWVQTTPQSTPGSGGAESLTTLRWCGQVACPAGARFRQRVITTGAPTQWAWFDVLGRPIMAASQTFNAGIADKDVSATCTEYDATGKTRRASNPFFLAGTSGSDLSGLSAAVCQSAPHWTTTEVDVLGRPTRVIGADNSQVTSRYDGLTTVTTDPRINPTAQARNGLGEVLQTTDALGLTLFNGYDAAGRLVTVRRDAGQGSIVNTFDYDTLGRKIYQNDPDSGQSWYGYNALGELRVQEDALHNRIETRTDPRGRVWRKTTRKAGGQIESESTFTFDQFANGLGKLGLETVSGTYAPWEGQSSTELSFSRSYQYDPMGRPQSAATSIDGQTYSTATEYDALGRGYRVLDASGRWSKTEFGSRGGATAVCDSDANDRYWACGAALLRTLETDAFGNAIREVRSPTAQIPVDRNFDARSGRLESICAGSSCGLVNEAYAWDDAGNLHTHQKEGRYLETFTYDALNRLQEGRLSVQNGVPVNTVLQSFAYDALGNVCSKNGVAFTYGGADGCIGTSAAAAAPSVMQAGSMPAGTTAKDGRWPNFRHGIGSSNDRGSRQAPMKVAWSYRSVHQAPDIRMARYESPRAARAEKAQYRRGMERRAMQARMSRSRPVAVTAASTATQAYSASISTGSPHAVSQTGSGAEAAFYYYDDRGNQTIKDAPGTTADRTIRYSLDDRAVEIGTGTGQRTRFWYGSDGQRYKREDSSGRTTLYLGNVEIIRYGGGTTVKRSLAGVMQQTIVGEAVSSHYLFHDHLGSLVRITDAAGAVVKGLDYAAFGERRDYDVPAASGSGTPITTRGYTGHEMLDGLGVIHMNGRIFDPGLGRFLQVDPFIQEPGNAQSWNAYTYVFNNPYRYTDPTGMLGVEERQWLATAVAIVAAALGQYYASFAIVVAGGFVAGAIATQSWRGGLMGAMTSAVTAGIAGGGGGFGEWAVRTFTGGVMGALQGGNFGHAFISAGLTAAFMPQVGQIGNAVARTVVGAIVGGTVSALTGGKFANGAVTGAIMAAMSGHSRGKRASVDSGRMGDGDGTDGAPEGLKARIRNPKAREALLNDLARDGWATARGHIKYVHSYQPGNASAPASTGRDDITFYKLAFEFDYDAILSIMDHEYKHFWQFQQGRWDGVRTRSAEGYSMELEAYDEQMKRSSFKTSSATFQDGISRSRQRYYSEYFSMCSMEDCSTFHLSGGR